MDSRAVTPALALLVALTRWPALSRTLWDWDEANFALAVLDFDVTAHHPHPPGFPLFIALAKLIPFDAFHALQAIAFVSSLFVFPAMLFLARELRMAPRTAVAAALLLSFFPNVWLFGGTAFSDVPSMVLAVTACALLLRGRGSSGALVAGAVVLAIAAGFRPQNLLIGFVPAILALRARPKAAIAGAVLGAGILAASYGFAAEASGGWEAYRETLAHHERYIRATDSFLSDLRPGLLQVADDFFLRPYRAPVINVVIGVLALVGFLRRRPWLPLAIFGPFLLFAWLYLDFHSASRFSIAYMPLFAILAAEAIPNRTTLAAVTALLVIWTWPALRVVHTTVSPPVAAIEAIRALPGRPVVYVDERLAAHAALLLPEYERRLVRVQPGLAIPPGAVLLREGASIASGARTFARPRARLEGIVRPRYFEVSVWSAATQLQRF